MEKMVGLALEGGGARGAYEAGAIKLLKERGYDFSAVCGTSIGAINAVMVAQNETEKLYELWKNMSYNQIFDIDENQLRAAVNTGINTNVLKYFSNFVVNSFKEKGVDVTRMREFVSKYIDEEKLRNSTCKYGLVTVCVTDKKGLELYIEDIPQGQLIDYVLASGKLPGLRQEPIDGKYYLDGGLHNNCPINMIDRLGIKDIIAIRVGSNLATKDEKKLLKRKDLNITIIEPNHELPNILAFDNQKLTHLLNLGYYDAIKKLDGLIGEKYYIKPFDEEYSFEKFISIENRYINDIYKILKLKDVQNSKKIFLEVVIPMVLKKIDKENLSNYKDALLALVECAAEILEIKEFEIFEIDELIKIIKEKIIKNTFDTKMPKVNEVILKIVKAMKI